MAWKRKRLKLKIFFLYEDNSYFKLIMSRYLLLTYNNFNGIRSMNKRSSQIFVFLLGTVWYVYFLFVYCSIILTGEVTEAVTSDGTHQPIYIIDVESTAEVARSGLIVA
jgi:hypothetical protein